MADIIIGTSPTTGEVLVRDDAGNMSWQPATESRVQQITQAMRTAEPGGFPVTQSTPYTQAQFDATMRGDTGIDYSSTEPDLDIPDWAVWYDPVTKTQSTYGQVIANAQPITKGYTDYQSFTPLSSKQLDVWNLTYSEEGKKKAAEEKRLQAIADERGINIKGAHIVAPEVIQLADGTYIDRKHFEDFAGEILKLSDAMAKRYIDAFNKEQPSGQLYDTYAEAMKNLPGDAYDVVQLSDGRWGFQYNAPKQPEVPSPISPYQTGLLGQSQAELQAQQQYWAQQNEQAQAQYQLEQQQFAWQQQQASAQAAQEQKNYMANLAANPSTWLEYAGASGATPMVQPWQVPLMPQQYAGTVAGAALPGWESVQTSIGQGIPTMANLPAMTTPSTQYQARMGPTAYQQYAGYEKARTGISPSETQFRLWSQAPPGGQNQKLRYY